MSLNIWNKDSFRMSGLGSKCKLFAKIKHIRRCIRWSKQRILRGYADCDVWSMYSYIEQLMPAMLEQLRRTHVGSPVTFDGRDCHEVWDEELDKMIFLWRECNEETCTKKNPYEEAHMQDFDEFCKKYGFLGEKLQTVAELEENKRRGGGGTVHFMKEIPEYVELDEKYQKYEQELEQYRMNCKDEVMDMMKEHFYSLWD